MKIHDWYCHGLSASCHSHRRTVKADTLQQIPSVMTCLANSGADHRDNGAPLSAAGRQANALTCERSAMIRGTGKIRSAVLPSCTVQLPSWSEALGHSSTAPMARTSGLSSSSMVAPAGPNGAKFG